MFIFKKPLETVLCILLSFLTIITFSQVIARYVFEAPLSWSEELARFILLWLAMLSAAYGFKIKTHFSLQFIVNRTSFKLTKYVYFYVTLIVSLFLIIFIYYSLIFVMGVNGHLAPALQIPMEIPYSSTIVGGLLMLYYVLVNFFNEIKKNKK
mgnify:CR=1 FL=1